MWKIAIQQIAAILALCLALPSRAHAAPATLFSGDKPLNNLVSDLLEVTGITPPGATFSFVRPHDGWVFIAAEPAGSGTATLSLNGTPLDTSIPLGGDGASNRIEAFRGVTSGSHQLRVECGNGLRIAALSVRAVPELIDKITPGAGSANPSTASPPAVSGFQRRHVTVHKGNILARFGWRKVKCLVIEKERSRSRRKRQEEVRNSAGRVPSLQ